MSISEVEHSRRLRSIASDTGLIAFVLIVLGFVLDLGLILGLPQAVALMTVSTLVLLAPGIWFAYASTMIRRGSGPVVRWSLFVALGQLAACGVAAGVSLLVSSITVLPVTLLVLFLPAQLVLLVQLWRARHLIRAHEAARGFAVTVALPVMLSKEEAAALPVASHIESVRLPK